jgi:hypothetical protein
MSLHAWQRVGGTPVVPDYDPPRMWREDEPEDAARTAMLTNQGEGGAADDGVDLEQACHFEASGRARP